MKRPGPTKLTPREPMDALVELAKTMGLYGFTVYEGMNVLWAPRQKVIALISQMLRKKMIIDTGCIRKLGGSKPEPIYIHCTRAPLEKHHARIAT